MSHSWKNTKTSLNLTDEMISTKVRQRIKQHEKNVADLAQLNAALKDPKISTADKEDYEIAKAELQRRVVDGDQQLQKDMVRLDKDKELNAERKKRLLAKPGPGRGHKKGQAAAQAPVVPITTATGGDSAKPAEPAKPAAAAPAKPAPAPAPAKPAAPAKPLTPEEEAAAKKKKRTILMSIVGFVLGGVGGAVLGKSMK